VESSQSSSSQSTRDRVQSDLQKALDDLRKAGESASGDVREGIESAMTKIRDASSTSSGDIRDQLDTFRDWLQSTTVDILDELEKEIRKRREQLGGSGGGDAGGTGGGESGGSSS
jgi:vacuolar-type H+-ATPase subunit H